MDGWMDGWIYYMKEFIKINLCTLSNIGDLSIGNHLCPPGTITSSELPVTNWDTLWHSWLRHCVTRRKVAVSNHYGVM